MSTNIKDREFTKFRNGRGFETRVAVLTENGPRKPSLKHVVNVNLIYYGYCLDTSQDKTLPIWYIEREITQSGITTTSSASQDFDQIWNNRTSLNYGPTGVGAYNNTFSTLFDGINDYCTAGDAFNYEHSQQFSASIWIKPNNFAATRYFLGNVEPVNVYGWRIGHDTSGNVLTQTRVSGGSYAPTTHNTTPLTAMAWNHVVFTWGGGSNNNQSEVFVNGVKSLITPIAGSMIVSWLATNEFQIGRAPANYFVGNIDEVTLWSKKLSLAEVSELHNAGIPNDPSVRSMSANLVNHYRMGDNQTFPTIINQVGAYENLTCTNMVDGPTNFVMDVP